MKYFTTLFSLFAFTHAKCPQGAIQGLVDDECFTLGQSAIGWYDAEEECVRQNGHLASVDSAFSNAFLVDNTNPLLTILWLGGVADGAPARWRWTDRTPFVYTNWAQSKAESVALYNREKITFSSGAANRRRRQMPPEKVVALGKIRPKLGLLPGLNVGLWYAF